VLRLWQNCDFVAARRVRINRELAIELERVMREYIKYLLEKQLKSITWLDRLKSEEPQK
jgi:recombinational DNA repair protein (RecF pathway)